MNNKELKTVWKLALFFWIGGLFFWILETSIFLIIEGWHLKATNPIEIYCDKIVSDTLEIALIISAFVALNLLFNLKIK